MDGSTTMHIWAQITEFRESVTTSKRKINVVVGGNVEGRYGGNWMGNGDRYDHISLHIIQSFNKAPYETV